MQATSTFVSFSFKMVILQIKANNFEGKHFLILLHHPKCWSETTWSFCPFQGSYPARLKNVFIISPPLWFKAVLSFFMNFLQERLKERIEVVPREVLPQRLPGSGDEKRMKWAVWATSALQLISLEGRVTMYCSLHSKVCWIEIFPLFLNQQT